MSILLLELRAAASSEIMKAGGLIADAPTVLQAPFAN